MRDEIASLSQELAGVGFETYRESYGLRRITERAIQIVSEAARALPEELRARYAEAPWTDIIGIGNPLRHEYHRIDDKVLWETATADLPKLQPIIQRMLAELKTEYPCGNRLRFSQSFHSSPIAGSPQNSGHSAASRPA